MIAVPTVGIQQGRNSPYDAVVVTLANRYRLYWIDWESVTLWQQDTTGQYNVDEFESSTTAPIDERVWDDPQQIESGKLITLYSETGHQIEVRTLSAQPLATTSEIDAFETWANNHGGLDTLAASALTELRDLAAASDTEVAALDFLTP